MGLDNMPLGAQHPCQTNKTAVMRNVIRNDEIALDREGNPLQVIDCTATQTSGGCPWKQARPPKDGQAIGMLGTDCWYRGKWGNHLLEAIGIYDENINITFYGDLEDGSEKSPAACIDLAEAIEERLADRRPIVVNGQSARADLKYAAWYTRWSASNGGMGCWS